MRQASGDERKGGNPEADLRVGPLRWLARLHAVGYNTALVAGLALMPPVIAVGYWTGHASDDGAGLRGASTELRGTFDGAEEGPRSRTHGVAF